MATTTSGETSSSSAADSYIGSLISLTSKSEIRYEGVLHSINTEESSIGLRNVRSFGSEGRKKDGQQFPPGDKVYEFILFRGSDIKDLQVKSSPPVQTSAPINSDPAIIQSHYTHPAAVPTSLPSSLPSTVTGPVIEISSQTAQQGLPGPNFQGGMPLYQHGGNFGAWGPSPPQMGSNGNGLAVPMNSMYWPGYYGPPNGLPSLQQQSFLRPPTGLPMPPSMQQPTQYAGFNNALPSGALNIPNSTLPEVPSALLHGSNTSVNMSSTSVLPSALPSVPSATSASEALPTSMSTRAPISAPVSSTMSYFVPLTTSAPDVNIIIPPISNKPNAIPGMNFSYPTLSRPASSINGVTNMTTTAAPTPSLITPGHLLQSAPASVSSSQALKTAHKDVEVVQVSSKSSASSVQAPVVKSQPPILPLPTPSRASPKVNGTPFQARNGYRGRERGRGMGGPQPVMKFTEEFDFIAMNEKFNKDEVWGNLGKTNKSNSRDENFNDEDYHQNGEEAESSVKTVYNKDDFFDTLSSNALDQEARNGRRPRFSEQMKMDTETFGEFSRYRGGRGGRGFNYNRGGGGGRYRDGYNDNRGGYDNNGNRGGYGNNGNRGGYGNNGNRGGYGNTDSRGDSSGGYGNTDSRGGYGYSGRGRGRGSYAN